jgi:hypothetical protein
MVNVLSDKYGGTTMGCPIRMIGKIQRVVWNFEVAPLGEVRFGN